MRRTLYAATSLALLACAVAPSSSSAAPKPPIALQAGLADDARLGRPSSLRIGVDVDVAHLRSPATEMQILTPHGLDLASSRLGIASCRRPSAEIERVLVPGDAPASCPRNSLLGSGTAGAALVFDPVEGRPISGLGKISIYAGTPLGNVPGLNVLTATVNPMTAQLSYVGALVTAPKPFGLGLRIQIRQIPKPLFGAQLALERMQVIIGGDDIVYRRDAGGKARFYRPGGVTLPDRCGADGLRFRLLLRFADGSQRSTDAVVPCPKAPA